MTRTRRMFLFIIMVTVLAIGAMAVIKYAGLAGLFPSQVKAIIAEAPVTVTVSSSVTKQRWMEEMARRFARWCPHKRGPADRNHRQGRSLGRFHGSHSVGR